MKNKKGFTLIELLAVIVILAIIALIAVPIVLNIIEKARKGAAKSSAMNYIKAIETYTMTSKLEDKEFNPGRKEVSLLNGLLELKGDRPESGHAILNDSYVVTSAELKYKEYTVIFNGKDYTVTKNNGSSAEDTPTYIKIVYLDPTDITKKCTQEQAESNLNSNGKKTGVKTGCMKWYAYKDDGTNYTMILDHNAIAIVKWNNEGKNVAYENSEVKKEIDNLNWDSKILEKRIISAEEIAGITGKTDFNKDNEDSAYIFDINKMPSDTSDINKLAEELPYLKDVTKHSKYDWLYNNVRQCKPIEMGGETYNPGCTEEDNNEYPLVGDSSVNDDVGGYWTSSTYGSAGAGDYVWVGSGCSLSKIYVLSTHYGIRPVIKVSKSQLS